MARRRPCSICKQWFRPHSRAGERQRACGEPACQRERHRRACARWRVRNPDLEREERLRRGLRADPPSAPIDPKAADPRWAIDWHAARDAVGFQVAVFVEETTQVLAAWVRDAVPLKVPATTAFSPPVPPPDP